MRTVGADAAGGIDVAEAASPDADGAKSAAGPAALASIFEEDGANTSGLQDPDDVEGLGGHSAAGGSSAVGDSIPGVAAEDEGRRICELLLRFDPIKLRTEFQQLYLHRLHYQSQQSPSPAEKPEVQAPEIDDRSRALAEQYIERQKSEAEREGGELTQHADLLLKWHSQVEAKKEEMRAQAKTEETNGCTFRPKTIQRPHDSVVEVTPRGSSRNEVLYARGLADRERRKQQAEDDARERHEAEVAKCTFKPNTAKSDRSYHRVHDNAPPVPRGFYETRTRLRNANAASQQKRQQKEDRLVIPAPVDSTGRSQESLAIPVPIAGIQNSSMPVYSPVAADLDVPHAAPLSPLPPVAEVPERRRKGDRSDALRPANSNGNNRTPQRSQGRQSASTRSRSEEQRTPRGNSVPAKAGRALSPSGPPGSKRGTPASPGTNAAPMPLHGAISETAVWQQRGSRPQY